LGCGVELRLAEGGDRRSISYGLPKFPWERRYHEDAEVERSATQVFLLY